MCKWMRDVVLGLEHLHHSGVCHRDLKPENILWDASAQRAKLADFGVSAICGEGRAGDYVRGTSGTPAFFAPETTLTLSPTPTPTPTLPLPLTLTLTV